MIPRRRTAHSTTRRIDVAGYEEAPDHGMAVPIVAEGIDPHPHQRKEI